MTINLSESSLFFRNALVETEVAKGKNIRDLVSESSFSSVARFMRKLIFVREVLLMPGESFAIQHSDPCLHMILPVSGNLRVQTQSQEWHIGPDDLWQWHSHPQHKAMVVNQASSVVRFLHIGWSELHGNTQSTSFDVQSVNQFGYLSACESASAIKMGLGLFTPHFPNQLHLENKSKSGMVICLDGQCRVGGELLSSGDVILFREHDVLGIQAESSYCKLLTLESALPNFGMNG
jgi:hypothetical protein